MVLRQRVGVFLAVSHFYLGRPLPVSHTCWGIAFLLIGATCRKSGPCKVSSSSAVVVFSFQILDRITQLTCMCWMEHASQRQCLDVFVDGCWGVGVCCWVKIQVMGWKHWDLMLLVRLSGLPPIASSYYRWRIYVVLCILNHLLRPVLYTLWLNHKFKWFK